MAIDRQKHRDLAYQRHGMGELRKNGTWSWGKDTPALTEESFMETVQEAYNAAAGSAQAQQRRVRRAICSQVVREGLDRERMAT